MSIKTLAIGAIVLPVFVAVTVIANTGMATTGKVVPDSLADCAKYAGLPKGFSTKPLAGMVKVPSGAFTPGSTQGYADEKPADSIELDAFWMDQTEVTNAQFAAFVEATAYVTEAEREGGAVVFQIPEQGVAVQYNAWWSYLKGASWRHPEGPSSTLDNRHNQPVVLVTLQDAKAYAQWLGRELPNEAQWEWAALGGGDGEKLQREPRDVKGEATANYWQGVFPYLNTVEDGYVQRSPVGCYPTNGYGLKDMIGNVWEWTLDPYQGVRQLHGTGDPAAYIKQTKSDKTSSINVIKGGSFLCAKDYCVRYRSSARYPQEADLGVAHVGFRTVLNVKRELNDQPSK